MHFLAPYHLQTIIQKEIQPFANDYFPTLSHLISRGHCEGGPTARSKNFKTPFFKRY